MRDIIEIIIENLTNERLDEIALADDGFRAIDAALDDALSNYYDTVSMTEQDSEEIENLFDLYVAHGARYAALAYQQGMIDSIELLRGLKII